MTTAVFYLYPLEFNLTDRKVGHKMQRFAVKWKPLISNVCLVLCLSARDVMSIHQILIEQLHLHRYAKTNDWIRSLRLQPRALKRFETNRLVTDNVLDHLLRWLFAPVPDNLPALCSVFWKAEFVKLTPVLCVKHCQLLWLNTFKVNQRNRKMCGQASRRRRGDGHDHQPLLKAVYITTACHFVTADWEM